MSESTSPPDPVYRCPAGDHPVFVYKSGAIVPHYNADGQPCVMNLRKHPDCETEKPAADPNAPVDSYEPDSCCGKHISKAIRSGTLHQVDRWQCPNCGELWTPEMHGTIRHWMPRPYTRIGWAAAWTR